MWGTMALALGAGCLATGLQVSRCEASSDPNDGDRDRGKDSLGDLDGLDDLDRDTAAMDDAIRKQDEER